MRLTHRVRRLDEAPAVQRRRAQEQARTGPPPTLFDQWLHLIEVARSLPDLIPDPELAQQASVAGAAIAVKYYEEGGDALRGWLRGQEYTSGETFTDEQIERVLGWCWERWLNGGTYLHPLGRYGDWKHLKSAMTPEERAEWEEERARHRFPRPADAPLYPLR